ncbi:unnamed protein product [Phytophthora lilii]|nr:unnamed protein product [Phytophthora lilii]
MAERPRASLGRRRVRLRNGTLGMEQRSAGGAHTEHGRFITILPMAEPVKASEFGAQLVGFVQNTDPSAEKLDVITKFIERGGGT